MGSSKPRFAALVICESNVAAPLYRLAAKEQKSNGYVDLLAFEGVLTGICDGDQHAIGFINTLLELHNFPLIILADNEDRDNNAKAREKRLTRARKALKRYKYIANVDVIQLQFAVAERDYIQPHEVGVLCSDGRYIDTSLDILAPAGRNDVFIFAIPGADKVFTQSHPTGKKILNRLKKRPAVRYVGCLSHEDCGAHGGEAALGLLAAQLVHHSQSTSEVLNTVQRELSNVSCDRLFIAERGELHVL